MAQLWPEAISEDTIGRALKIGRKGITKPFIENDQVESRELLAQSGERAIDLGKLQFREQFCGFEIGHCLVTG